MRIEDFGWKYNIKQNYISLILDLPVTRQVGIFWKLRICDGCVLLRAFDCRLVCLAVIIGLDGKREAKSANSGHIRPEIPAGAG